MLNQERVEAGLLAVRFSRFLVEKVLETDESFYFPVLQTLDRCWSPDLYDSELPEGAVIVSKTSEDDFKRYQLTDPQDIEALICGGPKLQQHPLFGYTTPPPMVRLPKGMLNGYSRDISQELGIAAGLAYDPSRKIIEALKIKIDLVAEEMIGLEELTH